MTNREALIDLLSTGTFEADILATSYIECPYTHECDNEYKYGTFDFQIYCDEECKTKWLEEEYRG